MGTQRDPSPPFSIRLLHAAPDNRADASQPEDWLQPLLPASYRTDSDDLAAPQRRVATCIEKELDLRRLHKILGWLWVAGRPVPPRPLHYQLLLGREIFVTEQMDMHLVWTTGRIFLKPIPRFLLEPSFWNSYLGCEQGCDCSNVAEGGETMECWHRMVWRCGLGFLFSYAALIAHESDFFIATDKHLLPAEATWSGWRTFVEQLDTEHIYPNIDARFVYGELRLSRLNKIYSLSQTPLHGYMPHWDQYGAFFQDHFTWLASAIAYIAIVLTAMQVGLATKFADNDAFQSASYGFTLFSILGPLVAVGLVVLAFCYMFVKNWVVTAAHKKRRFHAIQARSEGS